MDNLYSEEPQDELLIIGYSNCKEWENEPNCGLSFSNRIVGGKLAAVGKYPWLVRIGYGTSIKGRYQYLCGGTLIRKDVVITAAHCIEPKRSPDIIHVGETQITCSRSPCTDTRIQEVKVKSVIKHSEFSTVTGYADIALLKLERPVKYTDWVRPVCLSRKVVNDIGQKAIVAGWGMENYITRERPSGLKELTMEIIAGKVCKTSFPQADFNSKNYICGGGKPQEDTCGGDSGGPLMKILNLGDSPRMYLMGVISFGSTKCGVGKPGIFTALLYHFDWIMDHV
ncbi:hypothetical protein HHI36_000263 [Cryptolaemus montrouzieri]|uniref:Peptidase S1 domain-containing protein n=1 Tax=Cryptolaemus montrouzieri TaxID=559131 RepID=A0ABD2P444_9CUCU